MLATDAHDLRDGEPQLIDVMHRGNARVIGAWRVGDALIDPGPSSSVATLLPSLDAAPPRVIALTHIHLDHAGAAGTLAARFPAAEVWVHERGAPHMIDPSRLLASAERLYGADMQRLWGEFVAVPAARIRVLRGGERLGAFRVAYTPGHASHHVAYLHEPSATAFVGDVGGVRIGGGPVIAPTPPPDVDLVAWRASLDQIEAWAPSRLAVTHFGAHEDVRAQLDALREHLAEVEQWAADGDRASFVARMRGRVAGDARYAHALPPDQSYQGLARYLSKRAARVSRSRDRRSASL